MEKYFLLAISIIFSFKFLISKKICGDGLSFMGIITCVGLLGFMMDAYYFSYAIIFLGLISMVVIMSFERMLIDKNLLLADNKVERRKPIGEVTSFFLLSFVFGILVLIFKKNEKYFYSNIIQETNYRDIFEMIKNEYAVSVGLMMVLIFLSLISINLITKRKE